MSAPLTPVRDRQSAVARSSAAANAPDGASDLTPEQRHALDVQHQAFDFELAEDAEAQREREALDALLMERLKNEDDIMKKWIALA